MSAPVKHEFTRKRLMHVVLWATFLAVIFYGLGLGISAMMQFSGMGMVASSTVANVSGMTTLATVGTKLGLSDVVMASYLPYLFAVIGAGMGAAIGYLTWDEE